MAPLASSTRNWEFLPSRISSGVFLLEYRFCEDNEITFVNEQTYLRIVCLFRYSIGISIDSFTISKRLVTWKMPFVSYFQFQEREVGTDTKRDIQCQQSSQTTLTFYQTHMRLKLWTPNIALRVPILKFEASPTQVLIAVLQRCTRFRVKDNRIHIYWWKKFDRSGRDQGFAIHGLVENSDFWFCLYEGLE